VSINYEVSSLIALYRNRNAGPIKLEDGTFTELDVAYADLRVRTTDGREMFLLVRIADVPAIIKELADCTLRHNARD